jgi:transcriptional regulator with XRE-family HTH domain
VSKELQRIDKNPLSLVLGAYLRKERDMLRKTSNQVAQEIEIGSSFYRMIEAGSANLHPSRLLKILNAFPNSGIEFDLLSKYIVAIQMVETNLGSLDDLRRTVSELMAADADFEKLFKFFDPIWHLFEQNKQDLVKKHLDNDVIYYELREFLSNRNYEMEPEKRLNQELNELIDQTPSFYLEFALNTLKSLQVLPATIFFSELWKWEEQHLKDFSSLYGVVKDHNGVTDKQNLNRYQYKYLWEDQFQQVNLLFIENHKTAKAIKQIFEQNLLESLKKNADKNQKYIDSFEKAMRKVHIKVCPTKNPYTDKFIVVENDPTSYNAMWIFSMINNNNIGFLSYINPESAQIVQGTSLRYKDTTARLEAMKSIWNEI